MARKVPEEELQAIEEAVRSLAEPASIDQIMTALGGDTPRRTLQHRLKILVAVDHMRHRGAHHEFLGVDGRRCRGDSLRNIRCRHRRN